MNVISLFPCMLRMSVPLLLASLGVLVTAKAGIINMGMEGNMLLGAFVAVLVTERTGSPLIGLTVAALSGILYAMVLSLFIIRGRGNHVVCGLGMNFFIIGMTNVMLDAIWGVRGISEEVQRLPQVALPFFGKQSVVSLIIAITMTAFIWFMLNKMNFGLRIRAVGENPSATDSVGLSAIKYQLAAMAFAGILGALGGAELSIGQIGHFLKQMTASRGFLAYSAVIFAGYKPLGVLFAALAIGFLDAFQMRAQTFVSIPGQFLLLLPYLVTLLALIGARDRKKPQSLGKPYIRGN